MKEGEKEGKKGRQKRKEVQRKRQYRNRSPKGNMWSAIPVALL